MMSNPSARWISLAPVFVALIIAGFVATQRLSDYGRETDFFAYRVALNVSQIEGFVYTAGQEALLTLSPLAILPLSVAPREAQTFALVLFISGLVLSSIALVTFLSKDFTLHQVALIVAILILGYPTWVGMQSAESIAFAGVIFALTQLDRNRPVIAGVIVGIASLFHPSAVIATFLLGIYAFRSGKSALYWLIALLPIVAWLMLAVVNYGFDGMNGLLLRPDIPDASWQDWLWIGLFGFAVWRMTQANMDRRLFILPVWASVSLILSVLFTGVFNPIASITLTATVGIGIAIQIKRLADSINLPINAVVVVAFSLLLLTAPPQTPENIQHDETLANTFTIPPEASLLHNRSSALTFYMENFVGETYRFDGNYQPEIRAYVDRADHQSLIVATAPDFIYHPEEALPVALDNQNLAALEYVVQAETAGLWIREANVGIFPDNPTSIDLAFSPDVHLTGYALDRTRVSAENTIRLRLDWSLNRFPDEAIGININLNDINGTPITSIFTQFPRENWQAETLSTFHALRLPKDVPVGLLQVQVTLDYRAGILDRHTFGGVIVPLPQPETAQNLIGTLGSVSVYLPEISTVDGQLQLDLIWQTSALLDADYRVFIHITAPDDLQPLAQDDGLPLDGRYPTSYWLPEEFVTETRIVDISALPAGDYNVNIGLYTPEGGRLRNENADYLQVATLTIAEDGTVQIQTD
ncbi:MAG: hypothetical protein RLP44_11450 [Aggregatilineales bacterium]